MMDATRHASLKAALTLRRHALDADVRGRVRDGRTVRSFENGDEVDQSDAHVREDLQLALLQMRVETLMRIDEAIARLDTGEYGSCVECERPISERRLKALPFAVRCRTCADGQEQAQRVSQRGDNLLFPDPSRR